MRLRSRVLPLVVGLVAAGPLVECHRTATDKAARDTPSGDAVKQSLSGLSNQFEQLQTKFSALRQRIETVPPELPGFPELRAKFYAVEEGRGIAAAKVTLLAGRLDWALGSGRSEQLPEISHEISETNDEARQIDELYTALSHQVLALQRMAPRKAEASADLRR